MGLIVLVVACAIAVGRILGGRLAALGDLPVRSWQLLMTALLAQVGGALAVLVGVPAGPANTLALAVSGLLAALFCVRNGVLHGIALVGLGLVLNGIVIGLNGAMPVSRHAAARAGVSWETVLGDRRHEPAAGGTVLRPLGDVIPVPLPGRPEVVSVGDLLVAAGAAQFLLTAMLYRGQPDGAAPARPRPERTRDHGRGTGRGTGRDTPGKPPERRQRTAKYAGRVPRRRYQGRAELVEAESELVRVITPRSGDPAADPGIGAGAQDRADPD